MIHNDCKKGSVNIFTEDQISLIENIATQADAALAQFPASSAALNMAAALSNTDIYLIPYNLFVKHRENWCNSTFANKMRAKHDAAIEELEKRKSALENMLIIISSSNQAIDQEGLARIYNELEKERDLIEKIYKPWTSCPHASSSIVVYETPLGYYVPETKEVFICLDGIIAKYPSKVESVAMLTIFHELGHALMHNDSHKHYESAFEYWAEEALANKIALQTISVTRNSVPSLFNHAAAFVQGQPQEYALGYKLYEHNLLDWYALKTNKSNLNKRGAKRWLKLVSNKGITSDNIYEVQKAFYVAASVNDMIYLNGYVSPMRYITTEAFDIWLLPQVAENTWKKYRSNMSSMHMGLAYRALMNWEFDILADCSSSQMLGLLLNTLENNTTAQEFNLGTYGNAHSATKKYHEFLVSIGL